MKHATALLAALSLAALTPKLDADLAQLQADAGQGA